MRSLKRDQRLGASRATEPVQRGSLALMSTNTNGKSSTDASNGAYGAVHTEARTLTGWGRTAPAKSQVLSTPDLDEIVNAVV